MNKNGAEMPDVIAPNQLSFVDTTLTSGGTIGTQITYKLRAHNQAGPSDYSEALTVTVGVVPNAPLNLRISSQTEPSSVAIAWDPEAAIANNPSTLAYKVYLDDLSGNAPKVVFDTTDKALVATTTITGLRVGNTYVATVTATNEIGESSKSAPLTIHAGILPSKILSVKLGSSTTTSILLRWSFPESNGGLSLTKYTVYLDVGHTGAPTSTVDITDTLTNELDVTGLTSGARVDVQISASNINGEGELSDMRTFYVAAAPARPNAPTETKITLPDYSRDEAAIQVSWTAPAANGAPITGYKLYFAEEAREYELVYDGTGRSDILTFTVTHNVFTSKHYKFKVSAINIIGESELSATLSSFIAVAPSAPLDFAFVDSASGTITLKWNAPSNDGGATLTGYYVYYKQAPPKGATGADLEAAFSKSALISVHQLSTTLTGLVADTEYVMYVTAENIKGESKRSGFVYQFASAVPTVLAAPSIQAGSRTDTSITVQWREPRDADPGSGSSTTTVLGY